MNDEEGELANNVSGLVLVLVSYVVRMNPDDSAVGNVIHRLSLLRFMDAAERGEAPVQGCSLLAPRQQSQHGDQSSFSPNP